MNDEKTPHTSNLPLSTEKAERSFYRASASSFKKIPGSPIAYWLNARIVDKFSVTKKVGQIGEVRGGMTTADNDRFLRLWHEVAFGTTSLVKAENQKWKLYNKGGEYRRWYGNQNWIVNWLDSGCEIKKTGRASVRSEELYGKSMIGWTDVTSYSQLGVRVYQEGFLFDASGPAVFVESPEL